jgi:TetR/AcrR family transcriptional regulator, lmrAB and yxaGH operons repressor
VDDARDRMIDGTIRLLATRGLQGSSFSEVLKLTRAPRGSIYHHFPEGKDQLVGEAIERASQHALAMVDMDPRATPLEITDRFIQMWRDLLVDTQQRAGCSVLAVAVAADSPDLLQRAGTIFGSWESLMAARFVEGGIAPSEAAELATTLIAACEGAVVLSRAERSLQPFDRVARVLRALVAGCDIGGRPT